MNALFSLFLFFSPLNEAEIISAYEMLPDPRPSFSVYQDAIKGYSMIEDEFTLNLEKKYLTIIDFDLPSNEKRLWIIDLAENKLLVHTYVSHGKNSGGLMAESFSNIPNSNQSSLGFFITEATYYGKNGYSLRLDGIEKGINDNARKRAVVMHGAWYAEDSFIKKYGRLGRSFGCPAVPASVHKEVIDLVKEQTVMYIHDDSKSYRDRSLYVSSETF